MPGLLTVLFALILGLGAVQANGLDPKKLPAIGSVAPAFALHPFSTAGKEESPEAVHLDHFCGLRPEETKGVLLVFVDDRYLGDLELANTWHRKFQRDGLEVVAVSVDTQPLELAGKLNRLSLRFPVLDDNHRIVAKRYGLTTAPFSFLLNRECRVLGFSNQSLGKDAAGLLGSIEALLSGQIGGAAHSME
ncbi:MAG: TlpA disulfide reductase family protein [Myxococcota bacterium]|nr:TlpA disulfide reductase family protein [Myxococcota bacterium]